MACYRGQASPHRGAEIFANDSPPGIAGVAPGRVHAEGSDGKKIMRRRRNPGLRIGTLHGQTGAQAKAILDTPLLVRHDEYANLTILTESPSGKHRTGPTIDTAERFNALYGSPVVIK